MSSKEHSRPLQPELWTYGRALACKTLLFSQSVTKISISQHNHKPSGLTPDPTICTEFCDHSHLQGGRLSSFSSPLGLESWAEFLSWAFFYQKFPLLMGKSTGCFPQCIAGCNSWNCMGWRKPTHQSSKLTVPGKLTWNIRVYGTETDHIQCWFKKNKNTLWSYCPHGHMLIGQNISYLQSFREYHYMSFSCKSWWNEM